MGKRYEKENGESTNIQKHENISSTENVYKCQLKQKAFITQQINVYAFKAYHQIHDNIQKHLYTMCKNESVLNCQTSDPSFKNSPKGNDQKSRGSPVKKGC